MMVTEEVKDDAASVSVEVEAVSEGSALVKEDAASVCVVAASTSEEAA